jgi:hypothetical protein
MDSYDCPDGDSEAIWLVLVLMGTWGSAFEAGGPLIAIKPPTQRVPRWGTDFPVCEARAGGWIGEWATCLRE